MKKFIVFLVTFLSLSLSTFVFAQTTPTLKPHHQALPCITCHAEDSPGILKQNTCSTCHGSPEQMAEKTRGLGHNPHESIHWGTALPCDECHKQHQESRIYCGESCHYWPELKPK